MITGPDLLLKLHTITESSNGDTPLDVFFMASFFAPGDIPNDVFLSYSEPLELQNALHLLRRMLLIKSSDESSFFIPDDVRQLLRLYLARTNMEETVLKRTVDFLNASTSMEYPHLQSVYNSAKFYSSLFKDIGDLPGRILYGMLGDKEYKKAYSFGTDSVKFLTKNIGEGQRVVLELKSFLASALLVRIQKREEAIAMLTEVYNNPRHVDLDEDEDGCSVLVKLATVVIESNTANSEMRLRRIVFGGKKVADTQDHSVLAKWVVYSEILNCSGLMKEAASILDEVIERRRGIFGQDDEGILKAMHIKAHSLMEELKLSEAMKLLKSILERNKDDMEMSLFVQIDMGRVLMLMKKYKKSIQMLEKVKKQVKKTFGTYHELHFNARGNIIEAYRLQRDWKKVLKFSLDLTETFEDFYGLEHRRTLDCKLTMGDALLELGKLQDAQEIFEELLEIAEEKLFQPEEEIGRLQMRIFLTENADFMNAQTSLHMSAKEGDLENVLSLIKDGKDVEAQDGTGMTPLHYASAFRQVQVSKALIKKGARFNSESRNSLTPLQVAIGSQMKYLLRSVHFFFEAAMGNNIDQLKAIASKEPWVMVARDDKGCTPFHWAALRGHAEVLRVLLKLGCDPTVVSDKGNSPLHIAVSKGHVPISEALLQALGPAKAILLLDGRTNSGGNTPLHVAAERGFLAMVRILLAHGAVCHAKNAAGKTPLQLSKDEGCKNLLGLVEGLFLDTRNGCVESGCAKLRGLEAEDVPAVMRARNEENRTLLQEAKEMKQLDLAQEMLAYIIMEL